MIELIEIIEDLLTEFDEMGFMPTTSVPDPDAYAIEWREKLTKSLIDLQKQSECRLKVGDKVYRTDGVRIYESTVINIIYDTYSIGFDERAIGKTVFLSRDEATKALEEAQGGSEERK